MDAAVYLSLRPCMGILQANPFVECTCFSTGICSDLPSLANGMISYSAGSTNNRPINTLATFSCNPGYTLTGGGLFKHCTSEGSWSGSTPVCQRKWNGLWIILLLSDSEPIFQQVSALTYPR